MRGSTLGLVFTRRTLVLEPALLQVVVVSRRADERPALARLAVSVPSAWLAVVFRTTVDAIWTAAESVSALADAALHAILAWATVWFLGGGLRG